MCKVMLGDIEKKLVEEGYRVRVHYYHDGNCDATSRVWKLNSGKHVVSKYITQAVISDRDGKVIGVGNSSCAPKDNPVRKMGRHLAVCKAAKLAGIL